jgi:GTP-binding protein
MLDFSLAYFTKSVFHIPDLPKDTGAEVAFIGRSNVGKSSVINTLCNKHKLARTSRTPGRTQCLNFFSIGEDHVRIVDLPGYGFAKVPPKMKEQWNILIHDYLVERKSLRGLVVIMDIRHPLQVNDVDMIEMAQEVDLPIYVLLNKADKLTFGQAKNTFLAVQRDLKRVGADVQLFSAHDRTGLEELTEKLSRLLS